MAELWDLTRYVESHPEDYPQRWRLVKKLYMAWEYRQALEHLLVLKKEWARKQNVLRYLAAAYYRLGQYDEAITELREAIEVWPEEVSLREQLARVLEAAGKIEAAANLWEEISGEDAHHPVAARNVARLRNPHREADGPEPDPMKFDSSLGMKTGMLCPNCGAQNGEEFVRCWHCRAPLTVLRSGATPKPTPTPDQVAADPWLWNLVCGLLIVAFLSVGVYFTLQQWASTGLKPEELPKDLTVLQLLSRSLVLTRTIAGLVLLMAWPVALRVAAGLLRVTHVPGSVQTMIGLLLASLTYAATWLPVTWAVYTPLVATVASLALIAAGYRTGVFRTAGIWAIQALIVLCAEALVVLIVEGPQPLTEYAKIVEYGRRNQVLTSTGVHPIPNANLPAEYTIQWPPTGSSWLDKKAGLVSFEITPDADSPGLVVDFREGPQTMLYKDILTIPFNFTYHVTPGRPYQLVVDWRDLDLKKEPLPASITVYSVLRPHFIAAS